MSNSLHQQHRNESNKPELFPLRQRFFFLFDLVLNGLEYLELVRQRGVPYWQNLLWPLAYSISVPNRIRHHNSKPGWVILTCAILVLTFSITSMWVWLVPCFLSFLFTHKINGFVGTWIDEKTNESDGFPRFFFEYIWRHRQHLSYDDLVTFSPPSAQTCPDLLACHITLRWLEDAISWFRAFSVLVSLFFLLPKGQWMLRDMYIRRWPCRPPRKDCAPRRPTLQTAAFMQRYLRLDPKNRAIAEELLQDTWWEGVSWGHISTSITSLTIECLAGHGWPN